MSLDNKVKNSKNIRRNFWVGISLMGILSFNGCKIEGPSEVTVKNEPRGEIVGTVTWDPDGDGVYTAAAGASIERFNPGGGAPAVTSAGINGGYSYHDVPIGTYSMRTMEIIHSPYTVWQKWEDVSITKGNVSKVDSVLEKR